MSYTQADVDAWLRGNPELGIDSKYEAKPRLMRAAPQITHRRQSPEHDQQVTVMEWARVMEVECPELEMIHATPNAGKRSPREGGRMKAEGLKAGYPDLSLDVARGGYHGLRIEMKVGKNKPSESQLWWIDALNAQGYLAVVCYSADEAISEIEQYLELDN